MFSCYILRSLVFAATFIASNLSASPLDPPSSTDMPLMSAKINWRNSAGIQWRSYVVEDNCTIVEKYFDASEYVWKENGLPFCANPHTPISATFIGPSRGDPELIQVFYTDNDKGTLSSILWTESAGWRSDTAFINKEFHGFVGTAVAWKDSRDVQNIRLYAYQIRKQEGGDEVPLRSGEIVTAGSDILEIAWTSEEGWAETNGGEPILHSNVAVPFREQNYASVSPSGDVVRLSYCDKSGDLQENPEGALPFFNQAIWTPAAGWKVLGDTPYWVSAGDLFGGVRLSDEAVERMDRIRDSGYV